MFINNAILREWCNRIKREKTSSKKRYQTGMWEKRKLENKSKEKCKENYENQIY